MSLGTWMRPLAVLAVASIALAYPTGTATTSRIPPGVRYDWSIRPVASRYARYWTKFNAVHYVARRQLGVRWKYGTSKDRGDNTFDCSNFTAYVFRHALAYKFTTSSSGQRDYVGWLVPKSLKRPGDLLTFQTSSGRHVGIYVGNYRMIQCGGGLSKVGYLSVSPSSYWGRHLVRVKRLF